MELEAKVALNANVNPIASYTYTRCEVHRDNTYQGKPTVGNCRNTPGVAVGGLYFPRNGSERFDAGFRCALRRLQLELRNSDNTLRVAGLHAGGRRSLNTILCALACGSSSVGVNINNLFGRLSVELLPRLRLLAGRRTPGGRHRNLPFQPDSRGGAAACPGQS